MVALRQVRRQVAEDVGHFKPYAPLREPPTTVDALEAIPLAAGDDRS
jgi:hypothetical protein